MAHTLPIVGNMSTGMVCPFQYIPEKSGKAHFGRMTNRIRQLRDQHGMSRKLLAELVGTTANQLVKLENGDRRLSDHWADRLAPALGVQPYELLMPEDTPIGLRMIPVIGIVSCGNWKEAVEQSGKRVPSIFTGKNLFALEPEGDSMNLLITNGGYIIVDPDQIDLIEGKSYVVMNGDNEATAKRYRGTPPRLEPCSTNPDHQPIHIGQSHFRVIGRIVGVVSSL